MTPPRDPPRDERARQAEADAHDLAIITALHGNVTDTKPTFDAEQWADAAAEWDGIDL
jgi:hypothetical protein